jgi:serine/threonine-protein phosphatase 2A regulatory subunit B'
MSETHWHKVLQESLNALKTILKEIDPQGFEKALEKREQNKIYMSLQDPKLIKKERAKMDDKWKTLLRMAQQKNPNLKEPVLPYADTHVVGDFNGINNGNVNIS